MQLLLLHLEEGEELMLWHVKSSLSVGARARFVCAKTPEISYCFLCCHGHDGTLSRRLHHKHLDMALQLIFIHCFSTFYENVKTSALSCEHASTSQGEAA